MRYVPEKHLCPAAFHFAAFRLRISSYGRGSACCTCQGVEKISAGRLKYSQPVGLGVRGAGEERRHGDRRGHNRPSRQRRRGDRRRAGMRTLLLTAAALSAPHAAKVSASKAWGGLASTSLASIPSGPLPSISVTIDSFNPIHVRPAYDE